jgi:hypothetical protein
MISIKCHKNKINLKILKNNYKIFNKKNYNFKKLKKYKIKILNLMVMINNVIKKFVKWNYNWNNLRIKLKNKFNVLIRNKNKLGKYIKHILLRRKKIGNFKADKNKKNPMLSK